ncbi:MAG: efflux RND transporter permease subunit [Gammaproteobacteria bacterium]|nr:efflux RND transporter permease subunit [Gammaproteobacteria bacterium]MDH3856770.1 efflux RND transporter permease subunit [Gammaproteobacteria bacterium]
MSQSLGPSGWVAKTFLQSEITPLLALIGLLMGVFAVMVTPREEEPQINVTFANVFIPFPGATAYEVEQVVSTPAEQVLSEIAGVEHVYSVSKPGIAILTVQFEVGEARAQAIVRLYNKVFSNADWLPANMGVGQPIIKPRGIDDVPIVALTLWSQDPQRGGIDLLQVSHSLEAELKRVPGTRDIYSIGGTHQAVRILLDPVRLAGFNIDLEQVKAGIVAANQSRDAGNLVRDNREIKLQSGTFLSDPSEIQDLIIGLSNGVPIALGDIATIEITPSQSDQYVWFGTGPAAADKGISVSGRFPAVTLAVAKKPGSNAIEVADEVIGRIDQLRGIVIPESVEVTVTRNYGATANEKALTLIQKLVFATAVVVLLVVVTLGLREAFIVGVAIAVTLAMTLFASWAWGFTLNRVSLFALIFSIGILVDDAIVVVENIHRHMQSGNRNLAEAIPLAVDEVGGPTILATFAVVAALLPMAFVTGLMGPYMSPIPINASIGMLISLAVAFIVTPWLSLKLLARKAHSAPEDAARDQSLYPLFKRLFDPLLDDARGRRNRWLLLLVIILLILGSLSLAGFKLVVLKMLPFDNKSEVQVIVDMPEGSSLEQNARVIAELGAKIATVPEVTDYQGYVGTAAPINFNGLVRQYYLRAASNLSDIQVNLQHKSKRDRKSHDIALSMREPLQIIGNAYGANVKIVEVPPGPPVQAPIVAEIYGIDYPGQIQVARDIRKVMEQTPGIVDLDDSSETESGRWVLAIDRAKATRLGLNQASIANAVATLVDGEDVGYLHRDNMKYPVPLRLELAEGDKADITSVLSLKLRSHNQELVPLSEVVTLLETRNENSIYHKDLLPVVFVTANMAGEHDSPLYGMFDVLNQLKREIVSPLLDAPIRQYMVGQPDNPYQYSLKWDGEWQVTYETFRDMGIAYSVGLLMIYLLVVAQFKSYSVPLVIMAPIPLTVIGVLPGNALLGAQFTATSMIGMIALAGIIVRNSILLVDFINEQSASGMAFKEAVIQAAVVRARPIVLTALAAILGAFFILDDPIFSGLAIALIFGILISTLLTLVVIPMLYYTLKHKEHN